MDSVYFLLLFLLTLISLPSLSFCDDCPFPCLPPPPPPLTVSPPPPPPSPVYFSPPPPDTPSYWNYPPPPYTPGSNPYFQPPPSGGYIYGATPPPPDPILPYFPWYYHTSASTAPGFPLSLVISFVLFAIVGELVMF